MTFYLKYRPQKIKDLDLASVRDTLEKIFDSKDIPHAFLFSGPKGTGKTSSARILAKNINCVSKIKPCNKCEQCISISSGTNLDVVEIDAASHRGIDDIRELREAVKLAPALAAKKVYIIDEAHMLTTEASNALLKTLEEPPQHVVFILATTNPEKLIPTIRSRTTNVNFHKATIDEISRAIKRVVEGEDITIDQESIDLIAKVADGSFRDAVKVLEELSMFSKNITISETKDHLESGGVFDVIHFLEHLKSKDIQESVRYVNEVMFKGVLALQIIDTSLESLRRNLHAKLGLVDAQFDLGFDVDESGQLIDLLSEARISLKDTYLEQIPIEVAILKWCQGKTNIVSKGDSFGENSSEKLTESSNGLQTKSDVKEVHQISELETIGDNDNASTLDEAGESLDKFDKNSNIKLDLSEENWEKVLDFIREKNAGTLALLRAAHPLEANGSGVKIGVYYKFHKEHIESNVHRSLIEEVMSDVFKTRVRISCVLSEPPVKKLEVANETILKEPGFDVGVISMPVPVGVASISPSPLTSGSGDGIIGLAEEIFGN